MKKVFGIILVSCMMFATSMTYAGSDQAQALIVQLTLDDPSQVRAAAKKIINTGETDTKVLDALIEVMLQNHAKGKTYIDASRYGARAIGQSGNSRYYTALKSIADSKDAHKKMRKDAKAAYKKVGKPKGTEQYVKGSIDLAAMQASAKKAEAARMAELAKSITPKPGMKPITVATVGMNMVEVMALCGSPDSTTSHMTGKQFRPFNFKGGDSVRTYLLYKGQGYVVVTTASHYDQIQRVKEVRIDPKETGFR